MTEGAVRSLTGAQVREMFAAATAWLQRNAESLNAINVFPVPDGDTGTNMYLTMRSTMEEAQRAQDETAGGVLAAMAHGALMGARGNSGVILSQIIRGLAAAAEGLEELDERTIAGAFEGCSAAAYRAVTKPAEGTILTVIADMAAAAAAPADGDRDIVALLETAVREARESVHRTPSLLPVLAEAGVVDAGGQGLYVLFEGMLRHLKGEPMEDAPAVAAGVSEDWLAAEQAHQAEESLYGYCSEVLVSGSGLNADAVRERTSQLGDSVLVVGDESALRVHVHTDDPGALLSLGTSIGDLTHVKVENMRLQAQEFVQRHEERPEEAGTMGPIATVAVAAGEGMAKVFRSENQTRIVAGGPTMNPSTKEILDAIESCPRDQVIVLPNDKNIILAAQQAAEASEKQVRVVPSRSMPQGLAALLAMNPEHDFDQNAAAMEEALGAVWTIEVTRAVRSTTIRGVKVREGEVIAVVDDELKLAAESAEEAVLNALDDVPMEGTGLITVYYGGSAGPAEAEALAAKLSERFSEHELDIRLGGQPHYDYIISVE